MTLPWHETDDYRQKRFPCLPAVGNVSRVSGFAPLSGTWRAFLYHFRGFRMTVPPGGIGPFILSWGNRHAPPAAAAGMR